LEKLKADLESQHPQVKISTFELDVRNRAKVQATAATFGDVDVLVNNAGNNEDQSRGSASHATFSQFDPLLTPPFFLSAHFRPGDWVGKTGGYYRGGDGYDD
jgi:NAD(P)-dependent dehydrogenase (short-subunit alcohol dehydrogenase family)